MFYVLDMVGEITLGRHLYSLRKASKQTLIKVAEEIDMSMSYLSDLERGRTDPSLATLRKLAKHYKTSLSDIFKALGE